MEEIRLTEEDMKGFTYILWWPETNKKYYGVKFARNCKTSDIGTTYFSSSKTAKELWKEHGDPVIIIDAMFTDVDEARDYEEWMLQDNDVRNDDSWLNLNDRRGFPVIDGDNHYMRNNPDAKKKISGDNHYMRKRPEARDRMIGNNNPMRKAEVRFKCSGVNHHFYGKKRPDMCGDNNPSKRQDVRIKLSGSNSWKYDNSIYIFFHKTYGEYRGTRSEFTFRYSLIQSCVSFIISGKRKSHRGWRYIGLAEDQPES